MKLSGIAHKTYPVLMLVGILNIILPVHANAFIPASPQPVVCPLTDEKFKYEPKYASYAAYPDKTIFLLPISGAIYRYMCAGYAAL